LIHLSTVCLSYFIKQSFASLQSKKVTVLQFSAPNLLINSFLRFNPAASLSTASINLVSSEKASIELSMYSKFILPNPAPFGTLITLSNPHSETAKASISPSTIIIV
jgi:hypothetical protein